MLLMQVIFSKNDVNTIFEISKCTPPGLQSDLAK